jgi:hypothetical protein
MDTVNLQQNDSNYPLSLKKKQLGEDAPKALTTIGNIDILRHNSTALFCSKINGVKMGSSLLLTLVSCR